MVLFYPDKSGTYSQRRNVGARYTTGRSTQTFTFLEDNTEHPLRLDPFPGKKDTQTGKAITQVLRIENISAFKLGHRININGKYFQEIIVKHLEVDIDYSDGQLQLKSELEDPQIHFTTPSKLLSSSLFTSCSSIYIFGLIILTGMHWIVANRSTNTNWKSHVFILIILPVFLCIIFTHEYFNFTMICVLILTLSDVLITTLSEIIKEKSIISIIPNFIAISLFFLSIGVPLIITYTSTPFGHETNQLFSSYVHKIFEKPGSTGIELKSNGIEDSFLQHFKIRGDLLNLNSVLKLSLFQYSPISKLILGEQGVWFEGYGERKVEAEAIGNFDCISEYLGLQPFSSTELEEWKIILEERYYWLKEQGIAYVFVLAPNKSQIYPEYYPKRINAVPIKFANRRYDQLINHLRKHSCIPVVDLRNYLLEKKEQIKIGAIPNFDLFYRTDGHYNGYGAFWAYRAILSEINHSYPFFTLPVPDINDFLIRSNDKVFNRFKNALALKNSDLMHDTFLTLYPKVGTPHAQNSDFMMNGVNIDKIYKRNEMETSINVKNIIMSGNKSADISMILIAGDSFGQKLENYFSVNAKHYAFIRSVTKFNTSLISEIHPKIYIQEILNMYLQYKLPENPDNIKLARLRALNNSISKRM